MTDTATATLRLQDAGKVEWHGHWASPWCGMCIDYAAEKGVQLQMEMRDRAEVNALAGQPRMPTVFLTLADGRLVCVSESTRIIELLDRSYPPPEYFYGWSADPGVRAQQTLMEHGLGAIHAQVLEAARAQLGPQGESPALLENALAEQARILDAVNAMAESAQPFFFGDKPSVIDFQAFHVEPFNRCIAGALQLGKRDRAAFDELVRRMPILALLGDADFACLPDIELPAQSDGNRRWRHALDDRRESRGLRRGCLWQKMVGQLGVS